MGNLLSKNDADSADEMRARRGNNGMLIAGGGLILAFYGMRRSILGDCCAEASNALLGAGVGVACFGFDKHFSRQPICTKELLLELASSALTGKLF